MTANAEETGKYSDGGPRVLECHAGDTAVSDSPVALSFVPASDSEMAHSAPASSASELAPAVEIEGDTALARSKKPGYCSTVPDQLLPHLFKPGQSGNPKGRPRGATVAGRISKILADEDGKVATALAKVFVSKGLKGDFKFAKELIDRVDGKVPDRHAGHDGGPLVREVAFDLDKV